MMSFLLLLMDGFIGIIREELYPVRTIRSFSDFLDFSPILFGFPIILFFILIVYQKVKQKDLFAQDNTVICDKCGQVKLDDEIDRCLCSGNFVDIKSMKWLEEDPIPDIVFEQYEPKTNFEDFELDLKKEKETQSISVKPKICKYHWSRPSRSSCIICFQPLCSECFSKFLLIKDNKKIGFCSINCQAQYYEKQKEIFKANRRTSFFYIPIAIFLILIAFNVWTPLAAYFYLGGVVFFVLFLKGLILGKSVLN